MKKIYIQAGLLATAVACIVIPIKQIISEIKQKAFYTRIYNNKIESEFTYEKGKKIIWDIGKPYKVYWYLKQLTWKLQKTLIIAYFGLYELRFSYYGIFY